MYLYYLLAACGPSLQPYLWWKRYLTTIQLVQFVLVFLHALQPILFTCDYPVAASLMFAITGVQYFILFMAFYRQVCTLCSTLTHWMKAQRKRDPNPLWLLE
jgi:hypothetical protein